VEGSGEGKRAEAMRSAKFAGMVHSSRCEGTAKSRSGFGRSATRRAAAFCGSLRGVPWERRERRDDDGARNVSEAAGFARGTHTEAFGWRTVLDYRKWSAIHWHASVWRRRTRETRGQLETRAVYPPFAASDDGRADGDGAVQSERAGGSRGRATRG